MSTKRPKPAHRRLQMVKPSVWQWPQSVVTSKVSIFKNVSKKEYSQRLDFCATERPRSRWKKGSFFKVLCQIQPRELHEETYWVSIVSMTVLWRNETEIKETKGKIWQITTKPPHFAPHGSVGVPHRDLLAGSLHADRQPLQLASKMTRRLFF